MIPRFAHLTSLAITQDPDLVEENIRQVAQWVDARRSTGLPVKPLRARNAPSALGADEMNAVFALVGAGALEIRDRNGELRLPGAISFNDMIWPGALFPAAL